MGGSADCGLELCSGKIPLAHLPALSGGVSCSSFYWGRDLCLSSFFLPVPKLVVQAPGWKPTSLWILPPFVSLTLGQESKSLRMRSEASAALAKMVWTAGLWVSLAGVPGHFYFHTSNRMNWGAPKGEVINTWHQLLGAGIPGASHLHRVTTSLKSSLSSVGPSLHCHLIHEWPDRWKIPQAANLLRWTCGRIFYFHKFTK